MIQSLKQWSGVVALVILAIIGAATLFASHNEGNGVGTAAPSGSISFFTAVGSLYGYYIGSYGSTTQVIDDAGAINAPSLITADGGILHSYTNSTSTTLTTETLIAADITNYEAVMMVPNKGALTLTLPASSTLSSFIPTAGDWTEQCWYNATSTAAATITFAAGTGIDLEVASTTSQTASAPSLTIGAGNSACFKFIRKPATATAFDIVAQFTRFIDGD